MGKNDDAWEKLFNDFDILSHIERDGFFSISADEIKKYREPRLMTKFDSKNQLPKVFFKNKLAILPNKRGSYVIGKFKAYADLEYEELSPISVSLPSYVQTFNEFDVSSEAVALNIAQMTGMIDAVLENKYVEYPAIATITGRLKSGQIKYQIPLKSGANFDFEVNNSQVEIDAGYETIDQLVIIEAKSFIPENFMVRQLYYPYRLFQNLGTEKDVMPIYFTYSDGIYAFHIFEFTDTMNYGSIKKIKQLNFIVDENLDISIDDIISISNSSPEEVVKDVPFPQADNFTRVLDLLRQINGIITKDEITKLYGFDSRQSDYYANALIFLGLAYRERSEHGICLTKLGEELSKMPNNNTRNLKIVKQILREKCFNTAFDEFIKNSGRIGNKLIEKILLDDANRVTASSTAKRRTSTVRKWIDWIMSVSN